MGNMLSGPHYFSFVFLRLVMYSFTRNNYMILDMVFCTVFLSMKCVHVVWIQFGYPDLWPDGWQHNWTYPKSNPCWKIICTYYLTFLPSSGEVGCCRVYYFNDCHLMSTIPNSNDRFWIGRFWSGPITLLDHKPWPHMCKLKTWEYYWKALVKDHITHLLIFYFIYLNFLSFKW